MSVTLVDGENQWELEVADSLPHTKRGMMPADATTTTPLSLYAPEIQVLPESERLRLAMDVAMNHGGQIQTWNCPQGGKANVLVIPRILQNNVSLDRKVA